MGFIKRLGTAAKFLVRLVWNKFDGYKTIIGYILLQIPWLTDHPLLKDAIDRFLQDPQNPARIGELVLQILLALGVLHKIAKLK